MKGAQKINIPKKILMCSVLAEAFYKSRRELITEFHKKGYEIILVAPDNADLIKHEFRGMKVKYFQIKMERTGLNPIKDLTVIKQLGRIISKEKPAITYSFGGAKSAIYTTIAASKEKVYGNYCMINGLGSIFHGTGFKNNIIKKVMNSLFKFSLSKSDGVLFQNRDDLKDFTNLGLVDSNKCHIVNGSGVNLRKYPQTAIPSSHIFLFVGRLLKDKGIYEYIDAAKTVKSNYPETEFWIVGDYDSNPTAVQKKELSSWVDSGLVKYFGKQDNVLPFYQKSSVFVLPSYHEGTPRTVLEAMSVGRPIITTNAPGCKETIVDNENGFLIPIKDSTRLVEKMEYLIRNISTREIMGERSRELAESKYDVNKVNEAIIQILSLNTKLT